MKNLKHILLRLLFLLAILFCLGLEVYTHYSAPVFNTELSSNQNCEEIIVFPNVDFIEDDNINQGYELPHFAEQLRLIPIPNKLFLLKEYPFSSWQPPKFS